ncbi:MAG: hypothetical protein SVU32_05015 [Candidatus Nanohaloarchaea archaeon]|nr:hypothetical protein [Candidatus Nanohaloarchaea archaeon]
MDEVLAQEIIDYLETAEEATARELALDFGGRTSYSRDRLEDRYPPAQVHAAVDELEEQGIIKQIGGEEPRKVPRYGLVDDYGNEIDDELMYDDARTGEG